MKWILDHNKRRLLGAVFLVSLILFGLEPTVSAQSLAETGWSQPLNLSNSLSSSSSAEIVADSFGFLHVFWSEDMDGGPQPQGQNPVPGNGILYRSYRDGAWSRAVDIFYAGSGGRAWKPSAVADAQGFLNLVWSQNDILMYSRAPIAEASRPQAWSIPIVLDPGRIMQAKLLEDGDHLTVIYDVMDGTGDGVYSIDIQNGEPGTPLLIWPAPQGFRPNWLSAAVDGQGRVHVVWEVVPSADWQVVEVRYSGSDMAGNRWSSSRVVARTSSPETSVALANPWITAVGEDQVHIEWAQGLLTNRWHQYSSDGGASWSEPTQLWSDLVSQTASKAVGQDNSGVLYWVDVFRYPNGIYLTQWNENKWERPTLFYLMQRDAQDPIGPRFNVALVRMAMLHGNELAIVFQDNDRGEIYFMSKRLAVVPIAAAQLPTVPVTAISTPTGTPNPIVAQMRPTFVVPVNPIPSDLPVQTPPDPLSMILLSGGAALLFVFAVVFIKRRNAFT
jgi:hypothetical protein